ncbi:rust resistance kinase Lr10-like protein [Cinnamomum micranthum f. kanehirae]|uniref:non-specific serine/threonine protein kinase n=1 Tax=Cinnamomum micranthum f. kanehirae TaxID=337451 RepID=A0A3S3P6W3_9MAGN|nr:rust resistance kinase Lr10-like protein [Cinnamomum micranthum f. kanehirae]
MKGKSEELYKFIELGNTIHREFAVKIKCLRTDNGEEYISDDFFKVCSSSKDVVIGICVGGSIFTAATVMLAYCLYRKPMKQGNREDRLKVENILKECRTFKLQRYSYANIKSMTEKFKFKLGKGGYGTVYRGKLSNGIPVAVKILENSKGNGKDFINEIATIGRIHHVNVVRLLGFCLERTKRALIYEFLPNESLEKYIFYGDTNTHQHLGSKKLLDIAIGIARGIEYLHHGCDHHILHHDIKPHNILLDKDLNPKISDFGLAKICSSNQRNVSRVMSTRGTMGYIAPELFSRTFGVVSYKSDVYSFGMVMLEMVGGRMTRYETTDSSKEAFFPQWIYDHLGRATEIEGDEIARKLTIVALWCIQWNPNDRPPMKRVINMLEGKTESLAMPQNPFVSSEFLST